MKPTNSEWIRVNDSEIHGKGVFAAKDIPKNTKIIEYIGKKITKKEAEKICDKELEKSKSNPECGAVYIFNLNKDYDLDGNFDWNSAKFINHSCNPNCRTEQDEEDRIWIISSRKIKEGEELYYNYGYSLEDYHEHPCNCGSNNCAGFILAKNHWKKIKQL
jgi:uncharacterized protein